ncbi:MAG TPA: Gfo/Idh/MocA family oxidoreductase [Phycisphaerales bacterium]|nr:Gfo/Idh/MocA family oxidoreductase [Phycisphaerales bacterium]
MPEPAPPSHEPAVPGPAAACAPAAPPARRALRAAVVGTGKISEEHLRFLSRRPGATAVAVCDLSPALAAFAAERAGGGAKPYTDLQAMLERERPDVAHVLTPPHTHVEIAARCLRAGAHVIVEKPAAPTLAELDGLLELARDRARRLVENHNYRFNRPVRRIEDALEAGRLGLVREVEVRLCLSIRARGGRYADENLPHPSHGLPAGVVQEFLTHLCYLALRFLPGEPDRVRARLENAGGGAPFKFDELDALVDAGPARARLRFCCRQWPEGFTLTVRGTRGTAEADLFQPWVGLMVPRRGGKQLTPVVNQWRRGAGLMGASLANFWRKVMQVTPYEGLETFLAQTYDALERGSEPPVREEDMRRAARLIDALASPENRL